MWALRREQETEILLTAGPLDASVGWGCEGSLGMAKPPRCPMRQEQEEEQRFTAKKLEMRYAQRSSELQGFMTAQLVPPSHPDALKSFKLASQKTFGNESSPVTRNLVRTQR